MSRSAACMIVSAISVRILDVYDSMNVISVAECFE